MPRCWSAWRPRARAAVQALAVWGSVVAASGGWSFGRGTGVAALEGARGWSLHWPAGSCHRPGIPRLVAVPAAARPRRRRFRWALVAAAAASAVAVALGVETLAAVRAYATQPLPVMAAPSSQSRIEPVFGRVASALAGRAVEVRCWSAADWPKVTVLDPVETGGFADLATGTVNLPPSVCGPLDALAYSPSHRFVDATWQDVAATHVLAHEAAHLGGAGSERGAGRVRRRPDDGARRRAARRRRRLRPVDGLARLDAPVPRPARVVSLAGLHAGRRARPAPRGWVADGGRQASRAVIAPSAATATAVGTMPIAVLAREIGPPADVDRDERPALRPEPPLDGQAVGAERMGEVDDELAAVAADVGPVDPAQLAVADAAQARAEPVDLAARAEPGHGGQERQRRDQQPEGPAQRSRGRRRARRSRR